MSQFGTITINGKEYDLDEIELNDMEEAETLVPRKRRMAEGEYIEEPTPFPEFNFGSARVLKVLAWILLRRESPDLTLEDIGKTKLVQFQQPDEEVPDIGPPAKGADDQSTSGSPASGTHLSAVSIPG